MHAHRIKSVYRGLLPIFSFSPEQSLKFRHIDRQCNIKNDEYNRASIKLFYMCPK